MLKRDKIMEKKSMNESKKQELLNKNDKIINMVIERAKRDFPDDIAIIGLTGSFSTDDYHEKSDLDLIIINNTKRGWEISDCFILDDVGYDIYCTPWETRINDQSNLDSVMVSCLLDLKILYCAKPEHMDKFNSYKQKALDILAKPIGKECLTRAEKYIDLARQNYADTLIFENIGQIRHASCAMVTNIINAIVNMNNTYINRGIRRYREIIASYEYLSEDFDIQYMSLIEAKTNGEIRKRSLDILRSTISLFDDMCEKFIEKPKPTKENLLGTYEELWSNCRNKVIHSIESNDLSYAFHAALGAQEYLDEMTKTRGTKKFDLLKHFDADNLQLFKEIFIDAMDEYLEEYKKVGLEVKKYDTFEEMYENSIALY